MHLISSKLHMNEPQRTQAATQARAPIAADAVDPEHMCLRCSHEVARFLTLRCTENPNSTAFKCLECSKKKSECEKVSEPDFVDVSLMF
jgi:hypothetical protein